MSSSVHIAAFQRRAVLAAALLTFGAITFAAAAAAAPASSTPTPTTPAIESKKAERAAALAELERMRENLDDQTKAFLELGEELGATRADIKRLEAQIVEQDKVLQRTSDALRIRAVEMYRTDRIGMLEVLLSSQSLQDLFDRMEYVIAINRSDSRLIADTRLAQAESLWLQESLDEREERLSALSSAAEEQRLTIAAGIEEQQKRADSLGSDVVRLIREARARAAAQPRGFGGGQPTSVYNPDHLISDANFRGAQSMSATEIAAFLGEQPGVLKSYVGPDYAGVVKPAAQIISEAAVQWKVSPQVILVTLQKEQSLLQRRNPTQKALDWAMGAGKTDSRTYTGYQGFGKQVWWGAQMLDKNTRSYRAGTPRTIDGSAVYCVNESTWSLYKYTPHLRGTMSFWLLYWRYFGDPLSAPAL